MDDGRPLIDKRPIINKCKPLIIKLKNFGFTVHRR